MLIRLFIFRIIQKKMGRVFCFPKTNTQATTLQREIPSLKPTKSLFFWFPRILRSRRTETESYSNRFASKQSEVEGGDKSIFYLIDPTHVFFVVTFFYAAVGCSTMLIVIEQSYTPFSQTRFVTCVWPHHVVFSVQFAAACCDCNRGKSIFYQERYCYGQLL